jgi:NADPH-dependent curcumin reductase CurA
VSTAGSAAKEAAADGGLREVGIVNLERESLADGLARLAPGGVDIVIDALGGPVTGQAIGGLARRGRAVVVGYSAGTETTNRNGATRRRRSRTAAVLASSVTSRYQ